MLHKAAVLWREGTVSTVEQRCFAGGTPGVGVAVVAVVVVVVVVAVLPGR